MTDGEDSRVDSVQAAGGDSLARSAGVEPEAHELVPGDDAVLDPREPRNRRIPLTWVRLRDPGSRFCTHPPESDGAAGTRGCDPPRVRPPLPPRDAKTGLPH